MSRHQRYDRDHQYRYGNFDCAGQPRARSKIMGVCSGMAHQFGWDVTVVRILAVIGLFTLTGPVFLAYIIAGALFY